MGKIVKVNVMKKNYFQTKHRHPDYFTSPNYTYGAFEKVYYYNQII